MKMKHFKPEKFGVRMIEVKLIPKAGHVQNLRIFTVLTLFIMMMMTIGYLILLYTIDYAKGARGAEENMIEPVSHAAKNNKAETLLCDSDCKLQSVTERSKLIMERKGITIERSLKRFFRKHRSAVSKLPTSREMKKSKKRHKHRAIPNNSEEENLIRHFAKRLPDLIRFLSQTTGDVAAGDLDIKLPAPKLKKDLFEDMEMDEKFLGSSLKSRSPVPGPPLEDLGAIRKTNNSIDIALTTAKQPNLPRFLLGMVFGWIVVLITLAVTWKLRSVRSEQPSKHTETSEEIKNLKIEVPLPGSLEKNELRSVTVV